MKGVQCYELFRGIALKIHTFFFHFRITITITFIFSCLIEVKCHNYALNLLYINIHTHIYVCECVHSWIRLLKTMNYNEFKYILQQTQYVY